MSTAKELSETDKPIAHFHTRLSEFLESGDCGFESLFVQVVEVEGERGRDPFIVIEPWTRRGMHGREGYRVWASYFELPNQPPSPAKRRMGLISYSERCPQYDEPDPTPKDSDPEIQVESTPKPDPMPCNTVILVGGRIGE